MAGLPAAITIRTAGKTAGCCSPPKFRDSSERSRQSWVSVAGIMGRTLCPALYSHKGASSTLGPVTSAGPSCLPAGGIVIQPVSCIAAHHSLLISFISSTSIPRVRGSKSSSIVSSRKDGVITSGTVTGEPEELRLAGGSTECEERVEVKHQGEWGTVCDDDWNVINNAAVVCRQLGCSDSLAIPTSSFGQGSGRIWMDDVRCIGTESALRDCPRQPWGQHNCGHSEDVGVLCPEHREVRLLGGPNSCSGYLEIKTITWGSICELDQNLITANVICRELHCGIAVPPPWNIPYTERQGKIIDEDILCSGNETSIFQCPTGPRTGINCTNPYYPYVHCQGSFDGFRLVSVSDTCSGRVELLYAGRWGTLCNSDWDLPAANVLCRQLHCGIAQSLPKGGQFGKGDGTLWNDKFHCSGTESHLSECSSTALGYGECLAWDTAGVVCTGKQESLRLVDGGSHCAGKLEFLHSDMWSRVVDDRWDVSKAHTVCAQLHCGDAIGVFRDKVVNPSSDRVTWNRIMCEINLAESIDCSTASQSPVATYPGPEVGVICSESRQLRLAAGPGRCAGRVEVYHQGEWGTVCVDHWDQKEAEVVCRQLGCGHAVSATTLVRHGRESGKIWLNDLKCKGSESTLWECNSSARGQHDCGRKEAGVICSEFTDLRLAGGTHACEGRLEIYYNGTWGSVCENRLDSDSVSVICSQLGCGRNGKVMGRFAYGRGIEPYWLDGIECRKSAQSLWQCPSYSWSQKSCMYTEIAQIKCEITKLTTTSDSTYIYPVVIIVTCVVLFVAVMALGTLVKCLHGCKKGNDLDTGPEIIYEEIGALCERPDVCRSEV